MMRAGLPRCVVLGLDGLSYETLQDLSDSGVMPSCRTLLAQGKLYRMRATLPEISSVSWTSFITGQNAGAHGVFGFIDLLPGSCRLHFPNSLDIKSLNIFHRLGREGKRSVVINLPGSYPAPQNFPGVLVCGFVAADLDRAVYPLSLLPHLKEIGYRIDVEAGKGRYEDEAFLSDLSYSLTVRGQLLHKLWNEEAWDLFMFVVTETDRVQHFFFDAIGDPRHPRHEQVLDFFRQLDELIAEISDLVSGQTDCSFFILSDHGFYPLKTELNLNPILHKAGYGAAELGEDFAKIRIRKGARAFALDPSRIFVHDKERFLHGQVSKSDLVSFKEELKAFFIDLQVDGEPVIREVFDRDELYDGPQAHRAADLVLLSQPGFDLKGGLSRQEISGRGRFSGMHGYDNAFFFSLGGREWFDLGPSLSLGQGGYPAFSIERAAQPILSALEVNGHG